MTKKYKIRKIESTQKKKLKLIKLYLLNNTDSKTQINHEDIKKIPEKKSIFRVQY